ncbi:MAG: hypothetical protein L0Y36_02065 [Planctomycetales bacterium]|nr:hypothetical protein [Planctomycetales bacterium]
MAISNEDIQPVIQQVVPLLVLGSGVVLTVCGLFAWLGGLRWLKPVAAFSMALAGFCCAWAFTDRSLIPLVALPVVMGGCLAAAVVLAGPLIIKSDLSQNRLGADGSSMVLQQWNLTESVQRIEVLAGTLRQQMTDFFKTIPQSRKSLAMLIGLAVAGIGFFS